jgi:hypothetical protein
LGAGKSNVMLARKAELAADILVTTEELDERIPARRLDRLLAEITEVTRFGFETYDLHTG